MNAPESDNLQPHIDKLLDRWRDYYSTEFEDPYYPEELLSAVEELLVTVYGEKALTDTNKQSELLLTG